MRHDQPGITQVIGTLPYRMALAGGWIDQPFISQWNPNPPGAMVVVSLEPEFHFMERSGMGTSTRKAAMNLWGNHLPEGNPAELVRALYWAENEGKTDPSGSQDMAGLVYPGISRLDYDFDYQGGVFPVHVESCNQSAVVEWLEQSIFLLPVAQRPSGYHPLGIKNLDPEWIAKLGGSGRDCFTAIVARDLFGLGEAMNTCMRCWEVILPQVLYHELITVDLAGLLKFYQERYAGAMYSGCGGGYLIVASDEPVPGGFQLKIRYEPEEVS